MNHPIGIFFFRLLTLLRAIFGYYRSKAPTISGDSISSDVIPVFTYEVVRTYPHDRNAFTQGIVFENGILYEGTGIRGRSTLRKVQLETGKILQIQELPSQVFGEGVTIFGDKIIQLTWQSNIGFVYDKDSLELLQEFNYSTEGWGITHDGEHLIMSDGTSTLHFLDPESFDEIGRIEVYDSNGPVTRLNELQYIQDEIYANVLQTDLIARIAPKTGQVIGWIELKSLLSPEHSSEPVSILNGMRIGFKTLLEHGRDPVNVLKGMWIGLKALLGSEHCIAPVDVLNGIAYDAKNKRLFVTGKFWPKLFEIQVIPLEQST